MGCSNYPAWQLALALGTSAALDLARYDCVQPRYNALYREIETELIPLCRDQGIGVIVYNPLAGGFLTGKHRFDAPPRRAPGSRWAPRENSIASDTGRLPSSRPWPLSSLSAPSRALNLATASVAWVLAQPGITSAIVGASRPEQLEATLAAADMILDDETMAAFSAAWWSLPRRPLLR